MVIGSTNHPSSLQTPDAIYYCPHCLQRYIMQRVPLHLSHPSTGPNTWTDKSRGPTQPPPGPIKRLLHLFSSLRLFLR